MPPLAFEQLVALGSLVVAVVTVGLTLHRDKNAYVEGQQTRAAERQLVTDKLDTISDMSRETRDTVREMSKQLSDHSRELARIETRIEEHDRRLDKLETIIDKE